mgnify:CR=1 FL=1
MTDYETGEVILIPFPFTDLSTVKQRPAIILSSSRFNRERNDVIIAAITSHMVEAGSWDEYRLTPKEQRAAGLPKPSTVKLGKIVTLDRTLIKRRLGHLSLISMRRIFRVLAVVLNEQ